MIFLITIFVSAPFSVAEDEYFIRGIVRDSITSEVLPNASVVIPGSGRGVMADDRGIFEITVPAATKYLQISYVGYERLILPLKRNSYNVYAAYMRPQSTQLREVEVHRQRYSKHNNPAVDFMRRLKERAPLTDPRRHPYYSYDRYERITLGLNNFNTEQRTAMMAKFPFLAEHVDTSAVSGKPYLGLMVKEKRSQLNYRREPASWREIVGGVRSEGIDEMLDPASMRVLLEDIVREIDLYQNDITLLQNRFVSPLSRIAADFYKFYLTDTVQLGDERCIVLSFYPHNHASFGFMGHVYVPEGDTTMFIRRVEMHLPREINLNFINNLYLSQTYRRAPDGSRLKVNDDLTIEMGLSDKDNGLYIHRMCAYDNHSFDDIPDSVFSGDGRCIEEHGAAQRDSIYWHDARIVGIAQGESRVGELMQRMRSVPLFYWTEKAVRIMFTGYISTDNPSKFDIGPVNSMMSFNSTEGTRLKFGGMTTANLSKRWFARAWGAYGFRDNRWKYNAELEYSFIDKDYHSREFPMRSVRLTSQYDIDRPGQHTLFTTPDNIVLSLKRLTDDRVVYKWYNRLEFMWETRSQFSVNVAANSIRREAAPQMPLVDGYGNRVNNFTENTFELTLRYAPGEKVFQARSYRIPVNLDAPAITLRHIFAPKGFGGSRYAVNTTELDIQKRWWFSAFGYLDMYLGGGVVWSRSSFFDLLIPNANLSYIIEPRSFALLSPMEFIQSWNASFDLTYWANGALFNFIPYLKDLKLREVFCFRGFIGGLNNRANPALHPELLQFPTGTGSITKMDHGPYMETSVGIENIFKVLRVDYVWRLSYRDVPYEIDRHGVRIAVHVTF